ncbi:MAG: acyl-CoA desaturase, partial [Bacteroidetes bacterium]
MRELKFINNDALQKEFGSAVRKNVNAYFREKSISTKGDYTMYIKAFILLSVYIVPFVIILTVPISIWPALILVLIMGIGEAGVGMSVMHDGAHGAFSQKSWVNNLFASTMYLLGSNTFNWQIQHNRWHHTFTNIYGFDTDIDTKGAVRLSQHAPLKKYHRFQFIFAFPFYGLLTLSKMIMDFGQLRKIEKSGIMLPRLEMIKLAITKIMYLFVIIGLPLLLTDFSWYQVLTGFAILHVTAGMIMSTVFQMAHVVEGALQASPNAEGVIEKEWAVYQLYATSDFARDNAFL